MATASNWTGTTSRRSPMEVAEFFFATMAVFLAPMNFLKFFGVYVTASDLFAIACLLLMLVNRGIPLRLFAGATPVWLVGILFLTGGLMVSSVVNGDPTRGMIVSAQYFYSLFLLPLIIVGRPWAELVTLVKVFLISIVLMCLFSVYLVHIDGQTNTKWVSATGRVKTFVEASNEAASLIALTIPMLMWTSAKHVVSNFLVWPVLVLFIYGIMLAGSNAGLLMALFGLSVFLFFTLTWRQLVLVGILAAGVVASIATWGSLFLPDVFQRRVMTAFESGDIQQAGTFADRFELILEAIQMSNNTIFLGLGVDQFRIISESEQPVHNVYLLLFTEGGLISVIGFLMVILSWICPAIIRQGRVGSKQSIICALTTAAVFLVLINAAPHVYGRFWILPVILAVSMAMASLREGNVPAKLQKW